MQEETGQLVLIPHPTEELIFAKLQKELISDFFDTERVMYAVKPLWIETNQRRVQSVELSELCATPREIFIPVTITTENNTIKSKLSLVSIYSGKDFSDSERKAITQKKQPVRQLKIFRLGIEKELSPNSKCLVDSKWIKLHYPTASIE